MLLALYQSAFGPVARVVWGKLLFAEGSFVQLEQCGPHTNVRPDGTALELPKLRPKDPNSVPGHT